MNFLFSFTSCLLAYIRGELSDSEITDSWLFFGCHRSHVLEQPEGFVPCETTWANKIGKRAYSSGKPGETGVPLDMIDEKNQIKVETFLCLVAIAESKYHVSWKSDNQYEQARMLASSNPNGRFWLNGHWKTAQEVLND